MVGALLVATILRADGIPFKDGRVSQVPVLELKLTPAQSVLIERHYKSGMKVLLTKSQRAQIRLAAKIKIPPTKMEVFQASEIEHDCTCASANLAFPFKPGWVELPIMLLCSDKEAKDRLITE
jgi:hypothetical protein